jgi:tetratricopeptide (TPR) repeat protein
MSAAAGLVGVWILLRTAGAGAQDTAGEALALCYRASFAEVTEARVLVQRGIDLAGAAAARDPGDKVAHFALFCNLARRMRSQGLGLRSIRDLVRARSALDKSLQIDPHYADALAAKGAFLYYAPRLAGGDAEAGERLIRDALAIRPESPVRLVLVEVLSERRAFEEARREATRSLAALDASASFEVRAGARAVLEHLCLRELPDPVAEIVRRGC